MSSAQKITDLITAAEEQKTYIDEAREKFWKEVPARRPVTPNLIPDTYAWTGLCGGEVNAPKQIIAAHNGSRLSAYTYNGTAASGTLEVVTLDKLAGKGIGFGGDLKKATNGPDGNPPWDGSRFRVLLFDADIARGQADGSPGWFFVLSKRGLGHYSGWGRGEFATQAACFVNVVSQSGDIVFFPSTNMSATIEVVAGDAGQGWLHKHATRTGWGGEFRAGFRGRGRMKVALALLYVGAGDHGGAYVYAQSLGGSYFHKEGVIYGGD